MFIPTSKEEDIRYTSLEKDEEREIERETETDKQRETDREREREREKRQRERGGELQEVERRFQSLANTL